MPDPAVALVTGANKGIGFAIARMLGKRNFIVWLGCRDQGRGDGAASKLREAGIDARLVMLDVTSDESVRTAAARVCEETPALDVLVNNAGMNFGPPPDVSGEPIDQLRAMFETNALGPVRVTQAFLPLLRKSEAARVVMMSTGLGSHARTMEPTSENWTVGFAGYCASKSALNMFALKFAKELMADGIKVNIVDPGLTDTDLGGHVGRSPDDSAAIAVELACIGPFGPTGGFFHQNQAYGLAEHPW